MLYKIIKRKIPEALADEVRQFILDNHLGGVHLEADSQRSYPCGTLAAQVIGFTNDENQGSEGLEAGYDGLLKGTAGAVVKTRGNGGTEMLYSYEKYYQASNGHDLVLTIDNNVQMFLEKNKGKRCAACTENIAIRWTRKAVCSCRPSCATSWARRSM